jgi:hypothetical protein
LTTGVAVAASGFKKVAEFDLSQFVGLVPRDKYRLVTNDSVTGGVCAVATETGPPLFTQR